MISPERAHLHERKKFLIPMAAIKEQMTAISSIAGIVVSIAVIISSSSLYAGNTSLTGTLGMQFLKIAPGARPLGMANSFTALSDDVNAVYFNPAGLIEIDKRQVSFTHLEWLGGIKYEHFAYTPKKELKFKKLGELFKSKKLGELKLDNFAGSLSYISFGKFERRDSSGDKLGEEFGAYSLVLVFSGAKKIFPALNSGINIKLLYEKIDHLSSIGLAFDFGIKYFPSQIKIRNFVVNNLTLGAVLQNFGFVGRKSAKENNFLPLTLKLGSAYRINKIPTGPLTLALDLSIPIDNYPTLSTGLEFFFRRLLYLRAGYSYKFTGNDWDNGLAGFSFGMGFKMKTYTFDYAYVPYSDLGNTHRLSLLVRF